MTLRKFDVFSTLRGLMVLGLLGLISACVPTGGPVERGPALAFEGSRAVDTVTMTVRYRDGGAIPTSDHGRAAAEAARVSCRPGETAIPDTQTVSGDALVVRLFCVRVLDSDEQVSSEVLT